MLQINVTEFRNHLPAYLEKVKCGEVLALTSRGRVVARLVPEVDEVKLARKWLADIRGTSVVGDVTSPLLESWDVLNDPA